MAEEDGGEREDKKRVPVNTRLWDMLVQQAKAKFRVYPSLPASKWVHTEYVHRGGQFAESAKKDDRHDKRGKLTNQGRKEQQRRKDSDTRTGSARGNNQQTSKSKASSRKIYL